MSTNSQFNVEHGNRNCLVLMIIFASIGFAFIMLGFRVVRSSVRESTVTFAMHEDAATGVTCQMTQKSKRGRLHDVTKLDVEHGKEVTIENLDRYPYVAFDVDHHRFSHSIKIWKGDEIVRGDFGLDGHKLRLADSPNWKIEVGPAKFRGSSGVIVRFQVHLHNCDADFRIGIEEDGTLEYTGDGYPNGAIEIAAVGLENLVDELLASERGRTEYLVLHALPNSERPADLREKIIQEIEDTLDRDGQKLRKEVLRAETTTVKLWRDLRKRRDLD